MHATMKIANLEKIRQMIGENQKMFKEALKKVAILTKMAI